MSQPRKIMQRAPVLMKERQRQANYLRMCLREESQDRVILPQAA